MAVKVLQEHRAGSKEERNYGKFRSGGPYTLIGVYDVAKGSRSQASNIVIGIAAKISDKAGKILYVGRGEWDCYFRYFGNENAPAKHVAKNAAFGFNRKK